MKWILLVLVAISVYLAAASMFEKKQLIGETEIHIRVADSNIERTKGLSGQRSIREDEGMLFKFNEDGYYSMWMKNMLFPLDMAWLDKNKKIVFIEKNISPDSYPKTYVSPVPARYVLEVNAGFFDRHEIEVGQTSEF